MRRRKKRGFKKRKRGYSLKRYGSSRGGIRL